MLDERQPVGFALRDPYPWSELVDLAAAGEALGYDTLFLPEVGARDTLATTTGLAGEVARLRIGPGVVPITTRSPQVLLAAAATAHERSNGRLVLGLGTGPPLPGALDHLRRTVVALRQAFADGRSVLEGVTIERSLSLPSPPPIWLAALGPRAVHLAGELADGVLLNWCTPDRVSEARRQIAEATVASGREPGAVTIGVYVRAASASAGVAVRAAAAEYGRYPGYARQFAAMGIDPGDPDAIVGAVCVVTDDGDEARRRLEAYREAGADLPVVYPVVPSPRASEARGTLERFAS